jgi:phospholipase D1/2
MSRKRQLILAAIVLALAGLPFAWQFTGLADYANPESLRKVAAEAVNSPVAPLLVVGGFVLGGLVAFPIVVLIVVTAALFGPWLGMAYAAAGVAASGALFFAAGARLGSDYLRRLAGRRWSRLSHGLQRRGLLAVVALRVLPLAPFTLVNLAIGASGIRFADFAIGTLIGMGPGLVAMCLVGSQIPEIIESPSLGNMALLLVGAAVWVSAALAAQKLVTRLRGDPVKEPA